MVVLVDRFMMFLETYSFNSKLKKNWCGLWMMDLSVRYKPSKDFFNCRDPSKLKKGRKKFVRSIETTTQYNWKLLLFLFWWKKNMFTNNMFIMATNKSTEKKQLQCLWFDMNDWPNNIWSSNFNNDNNKNNF